MPTFNMKVPHQLTKEEVRTRVQGLLGEVKNNFADKISNLCEEWDGDTGTFSFSVMGFSVSGTLIVTSSEIEISGRLPFAATFFKNKIESIIKERAKTLLA